MAELIINGREALKEWGVRMGDNFLDVLGAPVPLKEFIENKSRLEHPCTDLSFKNFTKSSGL